MANGSWRHNLRLVARQFELLPIVAAVAMTAAGCAAFGDRSPTPLSPMTARIGDPSSGDGSWRGYTNETPAVSRTNSDAAGATNPIVDGPPGDPRITNVSTNPARARLESPPELPPVVPPRQMTRPAGESAAKGVIRGQSPSRGHELYNAQTPGTGDYWRFPMRASGGPVTRGQNDPAPAFQPFNNGNAAGVPAAVNGPNDYTPILPTDPTNPGLQPFDPPAVDFNVFVEEARTGRFMFGAGVNSDLGVTRSNCD